MANNSCKNKINIGIPKEISRKGKAGCFHVATENHMELWSSTRLENKDFADPQKDRFMYEISKKNIITVRLIYTRSLKILERNFILKILNKFKKSNRHRSSNHSNVYCPYVLSGTPLLLVPNFQSQDIQKSSTFKVLRFNHILHISKSDNKIKHEGTISQLKNYSTHPSLTPNYSR